MIEHYTIPASSERRSGGRNWPKPAVPALCEGPAPAKCCGARLA